jgi:branched-chain amino acid transport system permease protein
MKPARAIATGLVLTALLAVLPPWMSPYNVSMLLTIFMYVALAGSWNLFSGMTGYVSLGHGLFFGIGAYSFAVATAVFNLPAVMGLVLAVVVPGIAGFVIGLALLTTRIRIAYFAVVMLGLNEITKTIVANMKSIGSSYGLTLPGLPNRYVTYYILLALAAVVTAVAYFVQQSRWGYGLKALLADEVAAEMTGVHTVAHKLAMFVLSAIFIGLTGAVIAWNWSYVDPYMAFDLTVSFDMLVMAMFGGFGTVAGPVLGATLMSLVKEVLSTSWPNFQPIIFGVLVIILILWCPGGIIQAFEVAQAKLRIWVSSRPRETAT